MEHVSDDASARWTSLPSWLLTRTAGYAHRIVADGFAQVGGTGHHYRLLATLDDAGSASQATLGRRSGIHVSDLVAAINELAEKGFVERAPDLADRRRNVISLTAPGKRHLRRLERQLTESQDELLAPLSPGDRDRLTELLSALLAHHSERTGNVARLHPGSRSSR